MLSGKKTYIAGALTAATAVIAYGQGVIDPSIQDAPTLLETVKFVGGVLMGLFLRKGIKSDTGN